MGGKSNRRLHSAPDLLRQSGFLQNALIQFRNRAHWLQRQVQRERRPLALLARCLDASAVMMHDEEARHKMNAELARRVSANHERIEQTTQRLRRETRTVIRNLNAILRFVSTSNLFRAENHFAARWQTADLFAQQQFKQPIKLRLLRRYRGERRINIILHNNVLYGQSGLQRLSGLRHERMKVELESVTRQRLFRRSPKVFEQVVDLVNLTQNALVIIRPELRVADLVRVRVPHLTSQLLLSLKIKRKMFSSRDL